MALPSPPEGHINAEPIHAAAVVSLTATGDATGDAIMAKRLTWGYSRSDSAMMLRR